MKENLNLQAADNFAPNYDTVIGDNGWYSPDIVFGLAFEFIQPNQKVLDLGIGTGLSATQFKRAGCCIIGTDGSKRMLEICKSKNIAEQLIQHDFTNSKPFPFDDSIFNHIVSIGVFHLIGDLSEIFSESSRIITNKGTFSFTINSITNGVSQYMETKNGESGVTSYKHNTSYINQILKDNHFYILKKARFLAFGKTEWSDEIYFDAYITQKHTSDH